jgi:hypothetical protein
MPAVPTGTLFSVATTFGSNITVTAVTNANPAVCTATAHGLSNGDVIEVTSGWGRLNKRVFEVANVATNTFELEGMDTSSTSFFPAGTGIGTVREVTAWTQLSKVMNPATQGGDPKTVTLQVGRVGRRVLDQRRLHGHVVHDGIRRRRHYIAGYTAMRTLTDAQTDTVLKMLMRSGAVVYLPCTLAMNDVPRLQDGQINRISAQFAGNNRHTRYSA